jgi:hypothetical protein
MHSESIPPQNTRNFSFPEMKLDVISYLRRDSTVLFVMKEFLSQSLVYGAISCKVLNISDTYGSPPPSG